MSVKLDDGFGQEFFQMVGPTALEKKCTFEISNNRFDAFDILGALYLL